MDTKKTSTNSALNTSIWVLKLSATYAPLLIGLMLFVQLFTNVLPLVEQRYLSSLIDELIGAVTSQNRAWVTLLVIFMLIRVIKIIFQQLQWLVARILDFHTQNELRKIYLNKTASLDYQHFESKEIANLMSKVNEEYQWRFRQVQSDIFQLISQIISFSATLVFLFPSYWYLGLILVIGELPGLLVDKKWQRIDWETFNLYNEKNRPSWDIHNQLTQKRYIAEAKINQAIDWLKNKFIRTFDEYTEVRVKNRQTKFFPDLAAALFSVSISGICLALIIGDISKGLITVGLFTFYLNIIRSFGDYFSGILNSFISINEQVLHINNFRRILELPPAIPAGTLKIQSGSPPLIEFKNVYFKYPNTKTFIFNNLNLTIKPGEEIAIVGANGAGKSTLIKLICRFYDPTEGQILVNGIDLKTISQNSWYKLLSLLTQEFNIYPNLSLKDNIIVSRSTSTASNKRIVSALKQAEAYDFVRKYEQGLDTPLSQRYGGEEPSWGQWQKIAIARIFYRDANVLILDEPTASIDAVSEAKIFDRLYRQTSGKTLIIVSHRFSTVRNAQRILVIEKGKIIEQGTHRELLHLDGVYAHSYNLQARGYQEGE